MKRSLWLGLCALAVVAVGLTLWWWSAREPEHALERNWRASVVTLAGDGTSGSHDGWRTQARFADPFGLAVAPDGSLYVADAADAHALRRITLDGRVTTVASADFSTPSGVAVDATGVVYVTDAGHDSVTRITADGSRTILANRDDGLVGPLGVAVDSTGRVIVADTYNDRIVTIAADGSVRPLAGIGTPGFLDGAAADAAFDTPTGVAVDAAGNVYVADLGNGAVRLITPAGEVRTIAPDAGGWSMRPVAVAVAPDGSVFISDERGRVLELSNGGGIRVVAGSLPGFSDGDGETARFRSPAGIVVLGPGRLAIADRRNATVRLIEATSEVQLQAPPPPLHAGFDVAAFDRAPLLWPFAPFEGPFEITGTLGEARGQVGSERLHAGLDVYAPEGTIVHAVRDGVVDQPAAASDFSSLNESLRIGAISYIHMRVGRSQRDTPMSDPRFIYTFDATGVLQRVRVKRGARFTAGEAIGTVNRFYHSHLNIGWPGEEWNPLLFRLPFQTDRVSPTIRRNGIQIVGAGGAVLKNRVRNRLLVSGQVRVVVDAWDQIDGNEPRRRLGVYRLGYGILPDRNATSAGLPVHETIRFDRQPRDPEAPRLVYFEGSGIPVYGSRTTRFLYKVTTTYQEGIAVEGSFDADTLPPGNYVLRVLAADISGNEAIANRDLPIRIVASSGNLGER